MTKCTSIVIIALACVLGALIILASLYTRPAPAPLWRVTHPESAQQP
jgi:hypothetical protein